MSSRSVTFCTKGAGSASSAARSSSGLRTFVPSGSSPMVSMAVRAKRSMRRDLPVASKPSSTKPIGSMAAWHEKHCGFWRCTSSSSRTVAGFLSALVAGNASTFAGGGMGGGMPMMRSST
jgi:hypothetical protein